MNSSSSDRENDDDDCYSVQLEGSDLSPRASKVCSLSAPKETLLHAIADNPPTKIHHETLSLGERWKTN